MEYEDYLKRVLGEKTAKSLIESLNDKPVSCLRLNLLKNDIDSFKDLFNDLEKHPFVNEAFYFEKDKLPFGKNPLHNGGSYYIQDASAMMVAYLLNINKNDKVLDMCASPGGKSSQVASYLDNSGLLLSNDVSYSRCLNLSENIERMGIRNCLVSNETSSSIASLFAGYFDKVILDAPCSGQGMFRKNDKVMEDWTYNKTLSLAKTQKELILDSYKCLKKGGILVYSTCTFAVEENEEVVKYLLEKTNAEIIKIPLLNGFNKAIDIEGPIRLYPFNFKGEGHFIALIKSNDEYQNNIREFNVSAHRKEIEIYRQFERDYLNIHLEGDFIKMGDSLHLLPKNCFSLHKLKLIRNGLHLGDVVKQRFIPNHSLALALKKEDVKYVVNYDYHDQNIINYLKGLTLTSSMKKGYNLVCVNNLSLGWVKDDGNMAKNLYPKGLRNN